MKKYFLYIGLSLLASCGTLLNSHNEDFLPQAKYQVGGGFKGAYTTLESGTFYVVDIKKSRIIESENVIIDKNKTTHTFNYTYDADDYDYSTFVSYFVPDSMF